MDTATDLPPPREPLDHERVIRYLLERMVNRKLPRGCIFEAAIHFGCTQQTVSAIFRARDKDTPESARGFARVWTPEAIQEAVEAVPASERFSFLALQAGTGVTRTTLCRAMAIGDGIRASRGL
ncbi:hypothetical protein PI124_g14149 [Phytophthora idaei]|nr:hypothetical protein PI124_g14149 [Phytophthora idaei]